MAKLVLDPAKVFDLLKKDIQILENTKSRLIREEGVLQGNVNDLSKKVSNLKATLKAKEDELVAKYKEKEEKLDEKIAESNRKIAATSTKNAELDEAKASHEKAERDCSRKAGEATASNEKATKTLGILNEIVEIVKDKLSKI